MSVKKANDSPSGISPDVILVKQYFLFSSLFHVGQTSFAQRKKHVFFGSGKRQIVLFSPRKPLFHSHDYVRHIANVVKLLGPSELRVPLIGDLEQVLGTGHLHHLRSGSFQ